MKLSRLLLTDGIKMDFKDPLDPDDEVCIEVSIGKLKKEQICLSEFDDREVLYYRHYVFPLLVGSYDPSIFDVKDAFDAIKKGRLSKEELNKLFEIVKHQLDRLQIKNELQAPYYIFHLESNDNLSRQLGEMIHSILSPAGKDKVGTLYKTVFQDRTQMLKPKYQKAFQSKMQTSKPKPDLEPTDQEDLKLTDQDIATFTTPVREKVITVDSKEVYDKISMYLEFFLDSLVITVKPGTSDELEFEGKELKSDKEGETERNLRDIVGDSDNWPVRLRFRGEEISSSLFPYSRNKALGKYAVNPEKEFTSYDETGLAQDQRQKLNKKLAQDIYNAVLDCLFKDGTIILVDDNIYTKGDIRRLTSAIDSLYEDLKKKFFNRDKYEEDYKNLTTYISRLDTDSVNTLRRKPYLLQQRLLPIFEYFDKFPDYIKEELKIESRKTNISNTVETFLNLSRAKITNNVIKDFVKTIISNLVRFNFPPHVRITGIVLYSLSKVSEDDKFNHVQFQKYKNDFIRMFIRPVLENPEILDDQDFVDKIIKKVNSKKELAIKVEDFIGTLSIGKYRGKIRELEKLRNIIFDAVM